MSPPLHIGVFIPNDAQFLDVATVDVLGCMSEQYLKLGPIPRHILDKAPATTISYITSPRNGKDIPMTSGGVLKATHHYTDAEVAPGKLDIVVVPGPNPHSKFEKEGLQWLHDQSKVEGIDILSVCTGVLVCGGITNGNDLMAAFARDSGRWAQPVVQIALDMTDVGDRGQFYTE